MTRPFNAQFHCPNCRTWQTQETLFGRWIRSNKEIDSSAGYSVSDQDYWVHAYKTYGSRDFQCIMLVEIKTMSSKMSKAQEDTLSIVNQLMRNRIQTPTSNIKRQAGRGPVSVYSTMLRRYVTLKAFGVHILQFSGLGPDDSDLILWDGRNQISIETLTKILRFDLDPDTLKPLDLRNHHRTPENQLLALSFEKTA